MASFIMKCLVACLTITLALANTSQTRRQDRTLFSSFFSRPRGPCIGTTNKTGICSSASDCTERQGVPDGFCSRPYGVCCILLVTCDNSTNALTSYFINPGFPTPTTKAQRCRILLETFDSSICQIRLDFEVFQMSPPTLGECKDDFFLIDGVDEEFPRICGNNDKQHAFLSVERTSKPGPVTIVVITSGSREPRRWSIKMSQLSCTSSNLAPTGCLQYFPEATGILRSFNYHNTIPQLRGYPNDFQYAICLKRSPGFCGIKFETSVQDFDVGTLVSGNETAKFEHDKCSAGDFLQFELVMINQLTNRFCRASFQTIQPIINSSVPITLKGSIVGPPVVFVLSDAIGSPSAGFQLMYSLTPC